MMFKISPQTLLALVVAFIILTSLNAHSQGNQGVPPGLSKKVLNQIKLLKEEKKSRKPVHRKMSSNLVHELNIRRNDASLKDIPSHKSMVRIETDDTTLVDIKAKVNPGLLKKIESVGGTIVNSFEEYNAIRAYIPIDNAETLAARSDVTFIRHGSKPFLRKVNTSEGDLAHNTNFSRDVFSITGSGVKVGVLSDSVDHLSTVQSSGDLPTVNILEDAPGNSGEGTAMLEIIHDLAPNADLYFATAWKGKASFANNIQELASAGCDVIVDDVGYLDEFPFQDDIISQAVNTVNSQGVLYFSSAGNAGNKNDSTSGVWEGDFNIIPISVDGTSLNAHNFGGGDARNRITVDNECYTLFWSDPLGQSSNDYDLYLLDPAGINIVGWSNDEQNGNDDPIEGFCVTNDVDITNYNLVIDRFSGEDRFLHLSANGGRLEHNTPGQISGHPAAIDAFAVAAVNAQNMSTSFTGTEQVEWYTSDGPRHVFYNVDGVEITTDNVSSTGGAVRDKPDIAAADCIQTATPGFETFCGTSAAAPHAAGIAALLLSHDPNLTLTEVRQAFIDSALDIETAGWDRDSGYGIILADQLLSTITGTPLPDWSLSLTKEGSGNGTVISTPSGVNCGSDCVGYFYNSTPVSLNPIPNNSSIFVGWTGDPDCTDGQITMNQDISCIAIFENNFSWEMFVPTITGMGVPCTKQNLTFCRDEKNCLGVDGYWYNNKCNSTPQVSWWGAISTVYCSGSPLTFSLTTEGVTKQSTCQTGVCPEPGGFGTFGGWVETATGPKDFTWTISESACGPVGGGSFNYTLARDTTYRFTLMLNASNIPSVYVFSLAGQASDTLSETSADQINGIENRADQYVTQGGSFIKVDEIPLDDLSWKFNSNVP